MPCVCACERERRTNGEREGEMGVKRQTERARETDGEKRFLLF